MRQHFYLFPHIALTRVFHLSTLTCPTILYTFKKRDDWHTPKTSKIWTDETGESCI
jgi:hypothetical protein